MNTCVVGLQWGDEGKGKVVDILAERSEVVVRYGGGANAGHTVVIGDSRFALHLLPSGAIRQGVLCVIANAVVVDPSVLINEVDGLVQRGISLAGRLFISENAHVVLDYHKREDQLREESLGKAKIGTTIRGIGPCYADKVGRSYAVRMSDFRDLKALAEKLRTILAYKNKLFGALYGAEPMDVEAVIENCKKYADRLVPCTTDTTELLHTVIGEGKSVLFEGAQGSLLDLDHGTFPYVTSSNSSSLGLPSGCGVPAKMVNKYIGVVKAYTTRVGEGPFPTELVGAAGEELRTLGHEFGATTGRPRRCGWFDAGLVRASVRYNRFTALVITKLDVLDSLAEIPVATGYRLGRRRLGEFDPVNAARLEPVYETLPGWRVPTGSCRSWRELPLAARRYLRRLEELAGCPIALVSVGSDRAAVIETGRGALKWLKSG
jgi:adenylosuccinate synthase